MEGASKKVEKTGVYRHKSGHAVYLRAGELASAEVLRDYTLDAAATAEYVAEPEAAYFSSVQDAKPEAETRSEGAAPENRMDAPHDNRGAGDATDAENAANAAKPKR